jgi:hypothetical protein
MIINDLENALTVCQTLANGIWFVHCPSPGVDHRLPAQTIKHTT